MTRLTLLLCAVLIMWLWAVAPAQNQLSIITSDTMATFEESWQTAQRMVDVDGKSYLVEYLYNALGGGFIPSTNPPGEIHYDANITVYAFPDGLKKEIGKVRGYYVPGGCFEDNPETIVRAVVGQDKP